MFKPLLNVLFICEDMHSKQENQQTKKAEESCCSYC